MDDYKVEVRRDEADPTLLHIRCEIPILWGFGHFVDFNSVYDQKDEWAEDFIVGEPEVSFTADGARNDRDKLSAD